MFPNAPTIRILLVMDEAAFRSGLRMLLESWPEMKMVGESARTAEALAIAAQEKPDIAICDGGPVSKDSSFDFLGDLVRAIGTGGIILLSGDDDPEVRLKAVRLGVNGIVHKGKAVEELRTAILKVRRGEMWLDRLSAARFILRITRQSPVDESDRVKSRIASLTERERQVAFLICHGLQNEEIGKRLSISDTTVRHHLTSVFAKIGVSNRLELTVFLYRNNFASPYADQESAISR